MPKKLDKTVYCFILDEENQPWLIKWIEGEPGKTKLENFKTANSKRSCLRLFHDP